MKTPTAKQLPSGSWNCQVRSNGKVYSFTCSTKKEAEEKAVAFKLGLITPPSQLTLTKAIDRYIDDRKNILSPSTIAGYRVIQRNRFQDIMRMQVSDIDQIRLQRSVNLQAKRISAKSLHNATTLVQAVIEEACGARLRARLPQIVRKDLPWIQPAELPAFLEVITGSRYELAILLGLSGLRQSEILSVKWSDINLQKNTIDVHGATVLDENYKKVEKKENKNASSFRTIPIMIPRIIEIVSNHIGDPDAYVYHHYNNVLRLNINRFCEKIGIEGVGVHGLRRSFASLMYYLGVPELEAMRLGGWSDWKIMRATYTRIADAERIRSENKISEFFSSMDVQKDVTNGDKLSLFVLSNDSQTENKKIV